jgi:hypothetical protein
LFDFKGIKLITGSSSVGPYLDGQVTPSGTLPPISVPGMSAGSSQTLAVNAEDSALGVILFT